MHRALAALVGVLGIPLAAGQSVEVAACRDCKTAPLPTQPPAQILIRAKCTFSDGTLVSYQSFLVDARLSADEKRAAAERACEPVMKEAGARCEELANRVDVLKSEWRIAALHSVQERNLKVQITQALAAAPSYCKP